VSSEIKKGAILNEYTEHLSKRDWTNSKRKD
jgi:hypothetical protein